MKITHNKVGQNLNLIDGAKSEKTNGIKDSKEQKSTGAAGLLDTASSRVDVSARAQEAKKIKDIAMSTPDVDQAKVEKFRKLIDEGKYKVDAQAVADRMVDEHLETSN